jgi:hypothetical protein
VNTDAIYGKDYTYRDDVTKELMAKVVMENYDPEFASRTRAGDVVVSGFNFGTGSSREQAVTCLKAADLSAQRVQQWLPLRRSTGLCEAPTRAVRQRNRCERKNYHSGRRNRYRLHLGSDPLARRKVRLSRTRERATVTGHRRGSGEPGSEAPGPELKSRRTVETLLAMSQRQPKTLCASVVKSS